MTSRVARVGVVVGAALLVAAPALAQPRSGIALNQLEPAPAGDSFFGVPSPFARGNLVPRAQVMFDYAHQPLRLAQGGSTASVVGQQAFLHVNASFTIQDRLLISALVPVALVQGGDSPKSGGAMLASPTSAQIGDVRVGVRVRIMGEDDEPFQVGVGLDLHLPTAPAGSFAGEGTLREAPYLALGGRFKAGIPFVWTASVGAMVRSSGNPSMLTYGGGFAALLWRERLQLGPEAYASTPLQAGTFQLTDKAVIAATQTTNAELLVGARLRVVSGLVLGIAGGPGLSNAIGTPAFRLAGTIGWVPEPTGKDFGPADTDADGILDAADACPYAFGAASADPKRHGCPVLDDDQDGVQNHEDACPQVYGAASADPAKNGCPAPAPK